jgi:hypothetical protein
MCDSELWVENKSKKEKLQGVETDYLRHRERKLKFERVPNMEIRKIIQAQETVMDRIVK